jgi:acyl carrier protein
MLSSASDQILKDKIRSKLLIRIKNIINKVLLIPTSNITMSTDLKEDFLIGKLEILELVIEIENEFEIEIDRELELQCSSVSKLLKFLLNRTDH